jgi:hypothetical protein
VIILDHQIIIFLLQLGKENVVILHVNQKLHMGSERVKEREGTRVRGRNDPNIVCTYE